MQHDRSPDLQRARPGRLSRAWGWLWCTDSYLESLSTESLLEKGAGPAWTAAYLRCQRDVEDSVNGLRQRSAHHSRRLAEQARSRLQSDLVKEVIHRPAASGGE